MVFKRSLRFLTPTLHGVLDYSAALALVVLPAVMGLNEISPLATGISVTLGGVLVTYSLMTDYRFGLFRIISYRLHIILDLVAAIALVLVPATFGFEGLLAGYFWFMAGGVVLAVSLSAPEGAVFPRKGRPAGRFSRMQS